MEHIIIRNAISKEVCDHIATEYKLIRANVIASGGPDSDPTVPGAFAMYSPICFEALMDNLTPTISSAVGKTLYPSYSYARIYMNGCELKRHKDRRSSEYSVSCCITKDPAEWDLYIQYDSGVESISLDVGDIVIFQGSKYLHWRPPFPGKEQVMGFLQYVDSEGEFSHYKYDGRPMLGAHFSLAHPEIHEEMKTLNNGVIE
jgi:hypothetical protein